MDVRQRQSSLCLQPFKLPLRVHPVRFLFSSFAVAAALQSSIVFAQEYCATGQYHTAPVYPDESLGERIELSADSASSDPANPDRIQLDGTISIRHRDGGLLAENALFDSVSKIATVDGDMTYESAGLTVHSSDAQINVADGTFRLGASGYEVDNGEVISQGQADGIRRDTQGRLRLNNATYSSCPPGDNGWRLRAGSIKLDPDKGIGTARDVSLRFKDVPLLYAPVFSFPISNQRKTGLLAPRFDQNEQTGFEYRQPFYWNIRPNWDATFVLRSMSDRGFQLQTELRHLNRVGTWTLNHENISNDNRFNNASRRFSRFRHSGRLGRRWSTDVDVSSVSDRDYFEDLGDTLNIASITHLQRRGDLVYTAENYRFRTRLLSYQTVDSNILPDQLPYQQLPQLTLEYRMPIRRSGFEATIDSELVYFERDNSVTGTRLDIHPRIEWNINRSAWFTSLASSWRATRYDLSNVAAEDREQFRDVPQFSADAGLYFEQTNPGDRSILTLEPRLFYLYSARRDQSSIPIFDTGALDFNFSQLFRENRFSGADRINDANQLSLALSSRLINPDGRERYSASVGQILYFADREVTLPGGTISDATSSDIIAELQTEITRHWSGGLNLQWNPNDGNTQRSSAQISYRSEPGKLINFGHRFLQDDGEFLNASFAWPVSDRWRLASGWKYSLDDSTSIEVVVGLEYDSCCWAFRTAARRFITDDGDDTTTNYFFQLVLKGLAPVGQNVTEVLREAIGGYTSDND